MSIETGITMQNKQESISFLDFIYLISINIRTIFKIILFLLLIGIIFAIIKPPKFTATSTIMADISDKSNMKIPTGLSALKRFGLNFSDAGSGFIADTYPEIIKSKEVLYQVIHSPVMSDQSKNKILLIDLLNIKTIYDYLMDYTIKLPFSVLKLLSNSPKRLASPDSTMNMLILSEDEFSAMDILENEILSLNYDYETEIITINTKTSDPFLSAEINQAVLTHFRDRIRALYNQKTGENLRFVQARLQEAQGDLKNAEEGMIQFLERNSNPQTIPLLTELDRLKRDISFKENLYNELLMEYTQLQIELKKLEPVIKIINRPSPPNSKSGISKIMIVFVFFILGLLISLGYIFYFFIIMNLENNLQNKTKFDNIRQNFKKQSLQIFKWKQH